MPRSESWRIALCDALNSTGRVTRVKRTATENSAIPMFMIMELRPKKNSPTKNRTNPRLLPRLAAGTILLRTTSGA